jgi:hypothetical protein
MGEADRARRLRLVLGWVLLALAAAGLTYGLITLFTADQGPDYRFATQQHLNEQGKYLFYHPPDWEVKDQGTVSRVTSPGGETLVTFGLGPEGDLEAAETAFVTRLQDQYRDVDLAALQVQQVGPNPAVSVAGTGRNAEGIRLRFLAITVGVNERNFSIVVFTAANSDPQKVVPATQEIVNSFRPIG